MSKTPASEGWARTAHLCVAERDKLRAEKAELAAALSALLKCVDAGDADLLQWSDNGVAFATNSILGQARAGLAKCAEGEP